MRSLSKCLCCLIVGILAACSSPAPRQGPVGAAPISEVATSRVGQPVVAQSKSRWVAADWSALPGFADDALHEAWGAWTRSCEKPNVAFVKLCSDVRRMSIADASSQRAWMLENLQPYRVESLQGDAQGLLTGYFEPTLEASRVPTAEFAVPLFQAPANLAKRKPWFTRQEADSVPEAQAALRDRVIAYVADPVDAQVLQIQGSGQLRVIQSDGSVRRVRLAYAGSNEHPYRSIGKWLQDRSLVRDASWAGIKAWMQQNPQRAQELLWVNPRLVFFREVPALDFDAFAGPIGAQGVSLTAGRSIAVDPDSIPYGTPTWISTQGTTATLNRLVLAQDTGHAIRGAVRADYFVGSGPVAGEAAGRLRQSLKVWVLWPK